MSTPLDAAQVRELIAEGRERECPDDECNCGGYTTMRLCDALESALGAVERVEGRIEKAVALIDAHERNPWAVRRALTGDQHHG